MMRECQNAPTLLLCPLAAMALLVTAGAFADPPQYRLIDLHSGRLADGSVAHGINDLNEIVGEFVPDGGGDPGAFVWLWRDNYTLDSAAMLDLGGSTIGGPSGAAIARDINIDGKVVGEALSQTSRFPHLWDLDSFSSHGFIAGLPAGVGTAINDADPASVVGWSGTFISPTEAYRVTLGSTPEFLQPIDDSNDWFTSVAHDISDGGRVAGLSKDTPSICDACGILCNGGTWWASSSSSGSPLGAFSSGVARAFGINNSHDLVGTVVNTTKLRVRGDVLAGQRLRQSCHAAESRQPAAVG